MENCLLRFRESNHSSRFVLRSSRKSRGKRSDRRSIMDITRRHGSLVRLSRACLRSVKVDALRWSRCCCSCFRCRSYYSRCRCARLRTNDTTNGNPFPSGRQWRSINCSRMAKRFPEEVDYRFVLNRFVLNHSGGPTLLFRSLLFLGFSKPEARINFASRKAILVLYLPGLTDFQRTVISK